MPKAPRATQTKKHHTGPYTTAPSSTSAAMAAPQTTSPTTNERHSSSPWTPADDKQLMHARQQGLNWAPIANTYFPSKTPNACRKRHERLMEKRSQQDDWNGVKVEALAKAYIDVREQMWKMLADRVGERWQVVEGKCMEKGLKTLQNASRTLAKKERNQNGHFDDSGMVMDDTTHIGTDGSSDIGRDDQHPFLDSDDHMLPHSGRGDEQQLSSYSHAREPQVPPFSTDVNRLPRRTYSTTSSASTFTPVSATSPQTLPSMRSNSFFASILQPSSVTTH